MTKRAIRMQRDERGYWSLKADHAAPGTRYRFRLDDQPALPDPASISQPDGVHGDSEVLDRSFPWTDHDWHGIEPREMIIYEIHTGTFTKEGSFDGIRSKLSHLSTLGVNALEIMPVAQFPGRRNWGYDGVFPFAVQNNYGGATGLKQLVDEAHSAGIAIILDVVYNHQGPEGNYFANFGPYFTDKYKSFWGQSVNFDDAWSDGVREFYWQNALMWLDEFHIDGLRLDAVHAIHDFSADHFIAGLSRRVRELESRTGRRKVLIGEIDLNDPRYIAKPQQCGYGLDAQWVDEFHHAMHSVLTGEKDGYYEDFGTTDHLRKSLRDSYVYTGGYSVHRKRTFGVSASQHPYSQFVVFSQNHDQVGNRLRGDRLSTHLSFEAHKLAAAAVLLSPHIPLLFMGEEYAEKNPFQYFISHTDPSLVELVRDGRRKEFLYFNWRGEVPDPQSEETFRECVLTWNDSTEAKKVFSFYQLLIKFRRTRIAMQGVERNSVRVLPDGGDLVIFERRNQDDRLLVMLNFSRSGSTFILPASGRVLIDSAAGTWNGPAGSRPDEPVNELYIHPESAIVVEL